MQLTAEQQAIIGSTGNIKINAVAGSGKTSTLVAYAKSRPARSRILYLAFNKTVKEEAIRKFHVEHNLYNVSVETAHSLAFHHIVKRSNYTVRNEYKTHELAEILDLRLPGDKHMEYVLARHINRFVAYFCNSDKEKVEELHYPDIVAEPEAHAFAVQYLSVIVRQTRELLARMNRAEIEITHDFYLKKFQLSKPNLPFDYILFDEGQDASPAMLHVFLQQNCTRVIVGDTHQQIYGWRFAENALEKTVFQTFTLSRSFRFGTEIANLACAVLGWKKHFSESIEPEITGAGKATQVATKAVIARTNLGLLVKAIEQITGIRKVQRIYFEGNINSYAYADDGASLYDVLNLANGKKTQIRDKLVAQMKNLDELQTYIEKAGDVQLGMMVELVSEYGNEIPTLIKQLKDRHVPENERDKAEIVFSTVHRSKGLEYDSVQVVSDFVSEGKVKERAGRSDGEDGNTKQWLEEINLLYVAITRARAVVYLPEHLMPESVEGSSAVQILKTQKVDQRSKSVKPKPNAAKPLATEEKKKAYTLEDKRLHNQSAYQPWTDRLDTDLRQMFNNGVSLADMARHFGRTRGAVGARIKKLGLEEFYSA